MERYSDEYIWNIIHTTKLNDYVSKMPNGLNSVIEADGIGLSNGEKQVITCIRGLLSKYFKIMIFCICITFYKHFLKLTLVKTKNISNF